MTPRTLSRVFLDDEPVPLRADPAPQIATILAVAGRSAEGAGVIRLSSASATRGTTLRLNDIVDRTEAATTPIYLRSVAKAGRTPPTSFKFANRPPTIARDVAEWALGPIAPRFAAAPIAQPVPTQAPNVPLADVSEETARKARAARLALKATPVPSPIPVPEALALGAAADVAAGNVVEDDDDVETFLDPEILDGGDAFPASWADEDECC